jgi:hypothetical protein
LLPLTLLVLFCSEAVISKCIALIKQYVTRYAATAVRLLLMPLVAAQQWHQQLLQHLPCGKHLEPLQCSCICCKRYVAESQGSQHRIPRVAYACLQAHTIGTCTGGDCICLSEACCITAARIRYNTLHCRITEVFMNGNVKGMHQQEMQWLLLLLSMQR